MPTMYNGQLHAVNESVSLVASVTRKRVKLRVNFRA